MLEIKTLREKGLMDSNNGIQTFRHFGMHSNSFRLIKKGDAQMNQNKIMYYYYCTLQ